MLYDRRIADGDTRQKACVNRFRESETSNTVVTVCSVVFTNKVSPEKEKKKRKKTIDKKKKIRRMIWKINFIYFNARNILFQYFITIDLSNILPLTSQNHSIQSSKRFAFHDKYIYYMKYKIYYYIKILNLKFYVCKLL